jgi:hypothetical protein
MLPALTGSSGGSNSGGLAEIYDSPVLLRSAAAASDPLGESRGGPASPYPDFLQQHSGNVTAALGKTALLNCRVRNVGNKTVREPSTQFTLFTY